MSERFKKPTDKQLFDFAILFNEGKIQRQKLTAMVAMAQMIIDRLYDSGDIMIKSKEEIELEN